MCKSILDGGMGFGNLQAFNLAMLVKQAWHIMTNPNSLIARIYKAKYFPFSNILGAKLGCSPSYAWRSIYNSLEVIRKGIGGGLEMGRLYIFGKTSGCLIPLLTKYAPPTRYWRFSNGVIAN